MSRKFSRKTVISSGSLTDFQKQVYLCVLGIPRGHVKSYKWVAEKIGRPFSFRAVGTALKKNPYIQTVPCHRVIRSDGRIGGYSSGIKKKIFLLRKEKVL